MAHCQDNGVSTVTTTSENQLNLLRRYHQKAHAAITKALTHDEADDFDQAIQLYGEGIGYLAKGLRVQWEDASLGSDERDSARQMQSQMRKTTRQMKARLEELERHAERTAPSALAEPRAIGATTMQELEENLRLEEEMMELDRPPSYEQTQADAIEVFAVPDGVQIFFISPEGHVSAPSHPGPLRIYRFRDSLLVDAAHQPPAFLQVGDWLYPLVPGESPALRSRQGAFIFPDVESGTPGACVGVMFDPNIGRAKTQRFERAIQELTVLREQQAAPLRPPPPRTGHRQADGREITDESLAEEGKEEQLSTKIARGIVTGAEWISWGVGKGAEATSYLIGIGKEKLKQNLKTEDTPAQIDQKYQTGAEYAQKASVVAVKVSKAVVDSLCYLTKRLAQEASPYIKEQSDKFLRSKDQPDGKRNKTLDGVVEIAASGLQGFGTIYNGLETAAMALAKNISNATVEVVQHKYGDDAARFTNASLGAATNFGVTAYNLNHIGIKAITKRAVKDTGKAVLEEYQDETPKKTNDETNGRGKDNR